MATERQSPDAILSSSGWGSCVVTSIDDDPDSPDGLWCTASNNNTDTSVRVSFPTPTGSPTVGADLQEFRAYVRRFSATQSGNPTARIELWENGSLIRAGSDTSITTTGQVISFTWNANELGTSDGSLVECLVYGTRTGGSPSTRNTVDVGAIEWNVDYSAGPTTYFETPVMSGTGTSSLTTALGFSRTLTSSATGTSSLSRLLTIAKSLSYSAIGTSSITKALGVVRTLAISATGTNTVSRVLDKLLSLTYSTTGTNTVSTISTRLRTFVHSATGTNTLSAGLLLMVAASMGATGAVIFANSITYVNTLIHNAIGTSTLFKGISVIKSVSGIGTSVLTKMIALTARVASAVGSLVAAVGLQFSVAVSAAAIGTAGFSQVTNLILETLSLEVNISKSLVRMISRELTKVEADE